MTAKEHDVRRTTTRMAVATGALFSLLAVGVPTATASEDTTEATAGLIAEVAPDQGTVVSGEQTTDGVVAEAGEATVSVPTDPDEAITVEAVGDAANAGPLEVSLPSELDIDNGQVAEDGTVVYNATDDGASAAVQVLDDGSTRLQTITPDADGPHEFTYSFGDNVVPVETEDGRIELLQQSETAGVSVVVGTVDEAWAVDANGDAVATAYQIENGALVQTIDAAAGATYPVVADPRIALFWTKGDYVHVSSSAPRTASGHGWWIRGSSKATKAVVTVQLQRKVNGRWHNVGARATRTIGPGTAKRANARYTCKSRQRTPWRSVVDVDLVGHTDSPEKLYTPSRVLTCGV